MEERICEVCKKVYCVPKRYTQRFCSHQCQSEWQKTNVGAKNAKFTSEQIPCEWCGKLFYCKPCKIKNVDTHKFCSKECNRAWYAQVFSQQDSWKEQSRIRAVKILESGVISKTQSSIQVAINEILDVMKVAYVNEYNIKYYAVDNYLPESNLFIEVMGDFWHCNPIKYSNIKYHQQKAAVRRDKAKHTYIKNQFGREVLYLWEDDIVHDPHKCEKLIEAYISNDGVLQNYHSFNYNDDLTVNDTLIYSFAEPSPCLVA